jgi:hypothetical protein
MKHFVMAGLDPAIHAFAPNGSACTERRDARIKSGHDDLLARRR